MNPLKSCNLQSGRHRSARSGARRRTRRHVRRTSSNKASVLHRGLSNLPDQPAKCTQNSLDRATYCTSLTHAELERDAAEQAVPVSAKHMDVDQFLDGGFLAAVDSLDELSDSADPNDNDVAAHDTHVAGSRATAAAHAGEPASASGKPAPRQ